MPITFWKGGLAVTPENMTPELDMEELNKRRVERYHRRQQAYVQKKRKKME